MSEDHRLEYPNNTAEFWNRAASEKTFGVPLLLDLFASLVSREMRILDYGCGYGRICAQLADHGYRNLVGLDPSPEMIERARRERPDLEFHVAEDQPLPYAQGTFDAVLLISVLTCIPGEEDQRKLISEIGRVLRPGGVFYISDYPLQTDERNIARYDLFAGEFGTYGVFRLSDGPVMRHHDMKWIESLLAGFEKLHLSMLDVITMNGHSAQAFCYVGRKLE